MSGPEGAAPLARSVQTATASIRSIDVAAIPTGLMSDFDHAARLMQQVKRSHQQYRRRDPNGDHPQHVFALEWRHVHSTHSTGTRGPDLGGWVSLCRNHSIRRSVVGAGLEIEHSESNTTPAEYKNSLPQRHRKIVNLCSTILGYRELERPRNCLASTPRALSALAQDTALEKSVYRSKA